MNIIIDTHIFLWLVYDPKRVNKNHIKYLEDTSNTIYLSSISIAEMMIKKSIGNLDIEFDILQMLHEMDIEVLDFEGMSALELGALPFYHKDPFDRMIISQALSKDYSIISVDNKFGFYNCKLLS